MKQSQVQLFSVILFSGKNRSKFVALCGRSDYDLEVPRHPVHNLISSRDSLRVSRAKSVRNLARALTNVTNPLHFHCCAKFGRLRFGLGPKTDAPSRPRVRFGHRLKKSDRAATNCVLLCRELVLRISPEDGGPTVFISAALSLSPYVVVDGTCGPKAALCP